MKYLKDTLYTNLIQSSRWRKVRYKYLREHPVCEKCGHLATDIHHIVPLNRFRNEPLLMESKCFDEDNLMALCKKCHIEAHIELDSFKNKKSAVKERTKEQIDTFTRRWL